MWHELLALVSILGLGTNPKGLLKAILLSFQYQIRCITIDYSVTWSARG
jgi:hypothetical protein